MSDPTIGFVGLGNMGGPMSARLVKAGYDVRGFDVSPVARDAFTAATGDALTAATGGGAGGRGSGAAATNLRGAIDGADVIVLMLPNSDIVEATVRDPGFVAKDGATVIDMSSSEPLRTRALAAELAGPAFGAGAVDGAGPAFDAGAVDGAGPAGPVEPGRGEPDGRRVTLIDAPVSGGVKGAVHGKLTIMAGGDTGDIERVRPILEHLGKVTRAGDVGSGHAVKALNNLLSATHLLVTSEAILAGERFGLDPDVMLQIFNGSSGRSGSTDNKWPNFIRPGTFDSGFGLRLMLKDMRIATGLADQVGVPDPLGHAAVELWAEAADALDAGADHTEIVNWLRKDGPR